MQVHQLVPALHHGDAIGDSARMLRETLRKRGLHSEIYAYHIDEPIAGEALSFPSKRPEMLPEDVLILHFALPSGMTEFLKNVRCKKVIIYHNITPSFYWLDYDPELVHLASEARKQLQSLVPFVDRASGDSEYNREELSRLGFRNTCVLPIYVDQERYRIPPSPLISANLNDGFFNFLAVGRIAPNKKIEDVLRLYFFYKKLYSPLSRVIFAGKTDVVLPYFAAVKELSSRYGLLPEDVIFTGHIDWPELVAYYKSSHVLVSMSEHEGFCVPLVEAMVCETPILAYAQTAVPYTLGNAGIQFTVKDYAELAGICHRLREDGVFRNAVIESQKQQLLKYSKQTIEKAIDDFLAPLMNL